MNLQRFLRDLGVRAALAILAIAVLTTGALAQSNQGSIAGNVVDPTGAVIANATITAVEKATGTTYQTVSSTAGSYRFPNMIIGTYDVTTVVSGFKTSRMTGVVVQVASTSSLEIKLETGTVSETLEVVADAPTVQSETSEMGTVVGQKQIIELPLPLGSVVQAMRSPEAF